jgi:hypothetical protein
MRFRKLRIAWSVACGIACVLLIAFWVRSYWWVDQVFVPVTKSTYFVVGSIPNAFGIGFGVKSPTVTQAWLTNRTAEWITIGEPHDRSFYLTFFRLQGAGVMMPYWCGVLLSAALAAVPWMPWRFSLRTLLIATTLVALVLGAIVYAVR